MCNSSSIKGEGMNKGQNMKMETWITLFKVAPNGEREQEERFQVDIAKPWEIVTSEGGTTHLHFFPLATEEPLVRKLGGGYAWTLGYKPVPA
jgi:hypothetical protein